MISALRASNRRASNKSDRKNKFHEDAGAVYIIALAVIFSIVLLMGMCLQYAENNRQLLKEHAALKMAIDAMHNAHNVQSALDAGASAFRINGFTDVDPVETPQIISDGRTITLTVDTSTRPATYTASISHDGTSANQFLASFLRILTGQKHFVSLSGTRSAAYLANMVDMTASRRGPNDGVQFDGILRSAGIPLDPLRPNFGTPSAPPLNSMDIGVFIDTDGYGVGGFPGNDTSLPDVCKLANLDVYRRYLPGYLVGSRAVPVTLNSLTTINSNAFIGPTGTNYTNLPLGPNGELVNANPAQELRCTNGFPYADPATPGAVPISILGARTHRDLRGAGCPESRLLPDVVNNLCCTPPPSPYTPGDPIDPCRDPNPMYRGASCCGGGACDGVLPIADEFQCAWPWLPNQRHLTAAERALGPNNPPTGFSELFVSGIQSQFNIFRWQFTDYILANNQLVQQFNIELDDILMQSIGVFSAAHNRGPAIGFNSRTLDPEEIPGSWWLWDPTDKGYESTPGDPSTLVNSPWQAADRNTGIFDLALNLDDVWRWDTGRSSAGPIHANMGRNMVNTRMAIAMLRWPEVVNGPGNDPLNPKSRFFLKPPTDVQVTDISDLTAGPQTVDFGPPSIYNLVRYLAPIEDTRPGNTYSAKGGDVGYSPYGDGAANQHPADPLNFFRWVPWGWVNPVTDRFLPQERRTDAAGNIWAPYHTLLGWDFSVPPYSALDSEGRINTTGTFINPSDKAHYVNPTIGYLTVSAGGTDTESALKKILEATKRAVDPDNGLIGPREKIKVFALINTDGLPDKAGNTMDPNAPPLPGVTPTTVDFSTHYDRIEDLWDEYLRLPIDYPDQIDKAVIMLLLAVPAQSQFTPTEQAQIDTFADLFDQPSPHYPQSESVLIRFEHTDVGDFAVKGANALAFVAQKIKSETRFLDPTTSAP
ncbi:MAG: hypothetical protein KDD70_08310 [Bdellovibrionales bacterium]|nr:hypothetical protein [Bdellovibrionales bacterium]